MIKNVNNGETMRGGAGMNGMKALEERIEIAKRLTLDVATMKDWRIRNKHNRDMREIARECVNGRGYFIATAYEMCSQFGHICDFGKGDKKCVWALHFNSIWKKIYFVGV